MGGRLTCLEDDLLHDRITVANPIDQQSQIKQYQRPADKIGQHHQDTAADCQISIDHSGKTQIAVKFQRLTDMYQMGLHEAFHPTGTLADKVADLGIGFFIGG